MSNLKNLKIIRPDDWHIHLREGELHARSSAHPDTKLALPGPPDENRVRVLTDSTRWYQGHAPSDDSELMVAVGETCRPLFET